MFNAGPIVQRETGQSLTTTEDSIELNQSEYADVHEVTVEVTAVDSLVGGLFRLQEYDPATEEWQNAIQEVAMITSGGGNPQGVHENTAAANLETGSVVVNTSGVTAISDTGTFVLRALGNGKKKRLYHDVGTSGSGTFTYAYVGKRSRGV